MTNTAPHSPHVLRWIFRRGDHFLACELTHVTAREYALALTPLADREQSATETFSTGLAAFHRHADVANTLRESGWKVVAYTGPAPFMPDSPAMERPAA